MAPHSRRRPAAPDPAELPDANGRRLGRFPAWWHQVPAVELEAAHNRARQLVEGGPAAVQWPTWQEILGER